MSNGGPLPPVLILSLDSLGACGLRNDCVDSLLPWLSYGNRSVVHLNLSGNLFRDRDVALVSAKCCLHHRVRAEYCPVFLPEPTGVLIE